MGYQAVTAHRALSPPYLLSRFCDAQWLLFFPSPSHVTCHTKTKKQHWNNYISRAWTQCSAVPLRLLSLTLCASVCAHVCMSNVYSCEKIRKSSTATAQGFFPNCPPPQVGQSSSFQIDKTKDKHKAEAHHRRLPEFLYLHLILWRLQSFYLKMCLKASGSCNESNWHAT